MTEHGKIGEWADKEVPRTHFYSTRHASLELFLNQMITSFTLKIKSSWQLFLVSEILLPKKERKMSTNAKENIFLRLAPLPFSPSVIKNVRKAN